MPIDDDRPGHVDERYYARPREDESFEEFRDRAAGGLMALIRAAREKAEPDGDGTDEE